MVSFINYSDIITPAKLVLVWFGNREPLKGARMRVSTVEIKKKYCLQETTQPKSVVITAVLAGLKGSGAKLCIVRSEKIIILLLN